MWFTIYGVSVDGASGRTFTIDFAGHTYTIVGPTLAGSEGTKSQCFQLLKGSTITMKNGSIVADNEGLAMIIQNYCNLTLEDMTLDDTEGNNNVSYVMSNNCGNIKIKGNTNITAKNGTKAFDVCWAPNKDYPEGAQVTVDTTGTIKGDVEFDLWGNMASPVLSTLTINNGNFEGNFVVTGLNAEDIQAKVAVNGGAFTDLNNAVKYAKNGATVKLLSHVTQNVSLNGDKDITLDLNGKTLTGYITHYNKGHLTVKNGTVAGTIWVMTSATDESHNKLTVEKTATIGAGGNAVVLTEKSKDANNYGSTIDVYGHLNGNLWVMGNIETDLKTAQHPCIINVNDGAVINSGVDNVGIALNGAAKLNVAKAEITSGTGIEVRAGELIVDGATITGNATPFKVAPNGSGITTDGVGIAIAQHTTKLPINVTINGGNISGYYALYESNPQGNLADDISKVSIDV